MHSSSSSVSSAQSVVAPRDDRWIQLHSGAPYWPLNPEGCTISIENIAHGLACNNRFNGHTREPYSVAQHSVLAAMLLDIIPEWVQPIVPKLAIPAASPTPLECAENVRRVVRQPKLSLYGLLHDASEAVLHDVVRPIKNAFQIDIGTDGFSDPKPYSEVEDTALKCILAQFGLDMPIPDIVWQVDNILLVTEYRDLMNPSQLPWHWNDLAKPMEDRIIPWTWQEAEARFLDRFYELTGSQT